MMWEELEADARRDRYYEWLDEQPKCKHCGTLWKDEGSIYNEDRDEYFCDQACVDEYNEEHSGKAEERAFHANWEG